MLARKTARFEGSLGVVSVFLAGFGGKGGGAVWPGVLSTPGGGVADTGGGGGTGGGPFAEVTGGGIGGVFPGTFCSPGGLPNFIGILNACLQAGHTTCFPTRLSLTFNFLLQFGHEVIMRNPPKVLLLVHIGTTLNLTLTYCPQRVKFFSD